MILLLLLSLLFFGCYYKRDINRAAKLNELKQIATETPVFPDFKELDSHYNIKNDGVTYSLYYQSKANYDEVKSFYSETLVSKGWDSPKEESLEGLFKKDGSKRLIIRKGEYTIYIEYEGTNPTEDWSYSISYSWDKS